MIERAIENWLTKTNERNYQFPFCQVLAQQGHTILYISKHGQLEQGKDVISISPSGEVCGYQLKTGDISLPVWRSISEEVHELVELPIVHSSVPSGTIHKSFLVCNGHINDSVRVQIDLRNRDNIDKQRNYSQLETIELPRLVKEFRDASGVFLPQNLEDFSLFLHLFNHDGRAFLPKDKFSELLEASVFKKPHNQKAAAIHCVSASVLTTTYTLKPFQDAKNYFALFEAWTLLLGLVQKFSRRESLKPEDIETSLLLINRSIDEALSELGKEALDREIMFEGDVRGDGALMLSIRKTIVTGAICSHEVTKMCSDDQYLPSETLQKFVENQSTGLSIWGESSFPFFMNIVHYFELIGKMNRALKPLVEFYAAVLTSNHLHSDLSLPSPYDSPNDVLTTISGLDPLKVDVRDLIGRSYVLSSIVEMLARRNRRDLVEQGWSRITNIAHEEVRFKDSLEYFSWNSEDAINYSKFPKPSGSWAEIQRQATSLEDVPDSWKELDRRLQYWLMVCPHRMNPMASRFIDVNVIAAIERRSSTMN